MNWITDDANLLFKQNNSHAFLQREYGLNTNDCFSDIRKQINNLPWTNSAYWIPGLLNKKKLSLTDIKGSFP